MAVFTFKLIRLEDGIPSIEGNSLQDVLTGLGYVHAQDRGIQMLLMRLLGRGRLAQSLAPLEEFIHWDIYFRRLTPSAEEYMELDSLSPQIHLLLQAYCKGVNEWFETHPIPKLLQLLGLSWWPWKTTDIFLVGKLIGYIGLAETQAYVERWIRDVIRAGLPVQMLDELFPGMLIGVDPELISKSTEASFSLPPHPIHDIELLPQGSNNWVVSGDHSISGYPILANDPHIQINYLPSIWYEVVLKWTYNNKSCYAAGISIPGIPGIVIGRTAKLAWGVTYACIDNTDSWIEKCKPGYYWKNNKWIPFTKRAEIIYRRCKSPIQVCFYENEHGTITEPTKWNELMVITRWAVSTKDSLHSIEALLNLLLAHTVREARTLLSSITNGAWNWVIADRTGHIGFQMSGIVPIRANGWSGLIPMPGWDKSWDWLGFASPEALPSCEDPPEGILITANNPMDHYGKIHCTSFTMGHYRASRIKDLLLQKEKLTVDDMLQIQLDVFSPQAALYMERIKPLLPFLESKYPYHVKTLQQWDCKYNLESKGAAIFESFYHALVYLVIEKNLNHKYAYNFVYQSGLLGMLFSAFDKILLADKSLWFKNSSPSQLYLTALTKAFETPVVELKKLRLVNVSHLLCSRIPFMQKIISRRILLQGGRATIAQGQLFRHPSGTIAVAPSCRFITDLSKDEVFTSIAGGISDKPLKKNFYNRLSKWLTGKLTHLKL